MNKPTIILVVGSSGSGKTYLTHYLKKKYNIPFIVSYTTRPMRQGEADGVDHYYIQPNDIPDQDLMLAYTEFGGFEYFTLKSQVNKLNTCTYVVDEDGVRFFLARFENDYNIIPVYVTATIDTRLKRGVSRERIDRDNNREPLLYKAYKAVLNNDFAITDFQSLIDEFYFNIRKEGLA